MNFKRFVAVVYYWFCLVTTCWQHSGIGGAAAGKKNRTWKNLKQLLVLERTLPWKFDDPNCKFSCFHFWVIYIVTLNYIYQGVEGAFHEMS